MLDLRNLISILLIFSWYTFAAPASENRLADVGYRHQNQHGPTTLFNRGAGSGGRGGNGGNAGPGGDAGSVHIEYNVIDSYKDKEEGKGRGHETSDTHDEYGHSHDRYLKAQEDEDERDRYRDRERHRLGTDFHGPPGRCTCGDHGHDYGRDRYEDVDHLMDEEHHHGLGRFAEEHERERDWVKHYGYKDRNHDKEQHGDQGYPYGVSHGAGPVAGGGRGGDGGAAGNGGSGSYIKG